MVRSAGEAVKPGDNLFEIETDKVSMEVPSTTTGVLSEIRVAAGDVAPVGAVVAVITDGAGMAASPAASTAPPARIDAPLPRRHAITLASANPDDRMRSRAARKRSSSIHSSKCARRNAISVRRDCRAGSPSRRWRVGSRPKRGIDLRALRGSGPHGRIVARDIGSAPRPAPRARAEGPSAADIKALYAPGSYEEVPLDGMRRTIAARLTQAARPFRTFYLTADVEIGRLIALREEANAGAPKDVTAIPAFKLSLNDFIIRALALALQRVPAANAVWAGDRILRFKHSDIGIAVALDDGLVAPVLRQAETKSLSAISAEMKELAARARDKKLKPADYQGGSSAISNLGMYGVREFSAIINPPHATILAVGAARRQAVEKEDGGVAFVSMLSVTLSCDHRVRRRRARREAACRLQSV